MFHNCKNINEIKSLFRKLAMRLHPDYGGSNEMMITLTECYEMALQYLIAIKNDENKSNNEKIIYDKTYENVFAGDIKLKILNEIYLYAKKNKKFKLDFASSVAEYLDENGYITSNQYNRLVSIYYSWRMDKNT